MAITTPSMGLKRWDQPNDIFSYTELSDNFNLLDLHDHTSSKGVQIPTGGLANLAVTSTKLANDAVTNTKVLNATIADAKLASPNNGSWRTLFQWTSKVQAADISGTYVVTQGSGLLSNGSSTALSVSTLPFFPTHYSVAGKTLQLRLTVGGLINAVGPAVTIGFSLRPLTAAGGPTSVAYSAGAAVGGTEVTFASPTASTTPVASSTLASVPVQGVYGLGVTLSGTVVASSYSMWSVLLQYSHV